MKQRRPPHKPGHSLSIATEQMLFKLLATAIRAYCQGENIDRLPSKDADALRKQWTAEALAPKETISWTALTYRDVDRLKAYLIWQTNPTNETLAAAFATSSEDGERARCIRSITKNAELIWLIKYHLGENPRREEDYVGTIGECKNYSRNWRTLLLPLLENLMVTVEERKRSWVEKGVEANILRKLTYGAVQFRADLVPPTESAASDDEADDLREPELETSAVEVEGIPF